MPLKTFDHLPIGKKTHIQQALLTEFSNHSLADAQVARIVKQAHIARGAFYKYFTDLTDAYRYIYRQAMMTIHQPVIEQAGLLTADEYLNQVKTFITSINNGRYRDLVRLHFQANEGLLTRTAGPLPHNADEWAVMTLVHETIRECLLNPMDQERSLNYLAHVLNQLLRKEQ